MDLVRFQVGRVSDSDDFHGGIIVFHSSINKIQAKHAQERIEKGLNGLVGFPTAPHRRQSE
jgi:hypothetical protein